MNNASKLKQTLYFFFALFYQFATVPSAVADKAASYYFLESLHPVTSVHSKPVVFPGSEKEGEWSFFTAASLSNTLNVRRGFYTIDAESRRLDTAAQYRISDLVAVGAQLPLNWRGSGFTDGLIDDWHKTFGLNGGPRNRIEDDNYDIRGVNADYSRFDVNSKGTGLGNPQLTAQLDLHPLFTPIAAISLPGFDSDYAHRSADFTVGLQSKLTIGPVELAAVLLYQTIGEDDFQGLQLPADCFAGSLTAAMLLTEQVGLFAGYTLTESMIRELREANSYEAYLDVGLSYRSDAGTIYQFTVRENPGPQSNSVDISGVLSVRVL